MLIRLADWSYRSRRMVVALWIAALVGAFALAGAFGGESRQAYLHPGSESKAALGHTEGELPAAAGDSVQIVIHAGHGVSSPEVRARAEQVFADVAGRASTSSASPVRSARVALGQISDDGSTAYAEVALDKNDNEYTSPRPRTLVEPVVAASDDTMQVEVGGAVAALSQTVEVGSEGIGLIAAAIILLVVFGSAVAMGLPLLTALFGLGIAMSLGSCHASRRGRPELGPGGRGDGRDRRGDRLRAADRHPVPQQPRRGSGPAAATHTAMTTAGRAVMFAGTTVVVSMLGILLMGQPAMTGFAFSVVVAVLVVMAASVTLLPAVLGFAGRNIERLHVPFVESWTRRTTRRAGTGGAGSSSVGRGSPLRRAGRAPGSGGAVPGHPLRLPRRQE